jgi:hypothetical protein
MYKAAQERIPPKARPRSDPMEYSVRWQLLDVGKVRVGETVDKEHVWSELG